MAKDSTLEQLLEGFKDCLNDLWTLEVNTMVVSDIGGFKFNPFSGYEKIYSLPKTDFLFRRALPWDQYLSLVELEKLQEAPQSEEQVDEASADRNQELRDKIKEAVESSGLPSYVRAAFSRKLATPEQVDSVNKTIRSYVILRQRLSRWYKDYKAIKIDVVKTPQRSLQQSNEQEQSLTAEQEREIAEIAERDPGPLPSLGHVIETEKDLLTNGAFLRELRSLRELFYLIGGEDATDSETVYDLISAQTVIEMDGDVLNRFHAQLLASEHREFLLSTHQKAVSTGQENWQHLVTAIIKTVQTLKNLVGTKLFGF